MYGLQSTESLPDAVTQSSGESCAARRRKLRQAHLERLRSDNLVLLGAADDSSGSLRREPFSEWTVSAMQGDDSVLPTIIRTLPSSGVPKFNPELLIRKEYVNLISSPCYSGLYGRCERYDLQQDLQGGPRYK
ncbi:unnamed protein product [Polarella glacialis]|uniref:Uncharacterized protein n=1 Tax=Polarella glacialis TaxID=89957 RepID=A0A813LRL5_POLGL|nr:unnamed protein product [Polarella glacialis]